MLRWLVVVAGVLAGCVAPNAVTCPSGLVCPDGSECRTVYNVETCVTDDMEKACVGHLELDLCVEGDERFHCFDGVCLDACGNNNIEPGETCDDGNKLSNDGCSERCVDELCGNGVIDVIKGEQCDDGIAGLSGDGCSSNCQLEAARWVEVTPTSPSARAGFTIVRDTVRNRMIMFGGLGDDGTNAETWELGNASSDTRLLVTAHSPSPRQEYGMAYDSARDRIVLFGGYGPSGLLDDTWEFDGVDWKEITPAMRPAERKNLALAYDVVRQRIVLFGGSSINASYDDVWEYDGAEWTPKPTSGTRPTPTAFPHLVYHAATSQLLEMHWDANFSPQSLSFQTWQWSVSGWTLLNSTQFVDRDVFSSVAYDPGTSSTWVVFSGGSFWHKWNNNAWTSGAATSPPSYRTIPGFIHDGVGMGLFGGFVGGYPDSDTGVFVADRLRFNTTTNTYSRVADGVGMPSVSHRGGDDFYMNRSGQHVIFGGDQAGDEIADAWGRNGWEAFATQPVFPPSPGNYITQAGATYDVKNDRGVVFGGHSDTFFFDATWLVSPTGTWTQVLNLATKPSARTNPGLAYDVARSETILFGGATGNGDPLTALGDTWRFDGTAWMQLSPTTTPPARYGHLMAYDPVRKRIVLFGGSVTNLFSLSDTWEWDGTNWIQMQVTVTPGAHTSAAMAYDPLRRRVVVTGGTDDEVNFATYADRWEWDGTAWTRLTDAPLPRKDHFMAFDQVRGGLLVYSGTSSEISGGRLRESWLLRYESLDPRETCLVPTQDLDGDGLAGCADPDCWGRCTPQCPPGTVCAADTPRCGDGTCNGFLEDKLLCPMDNCP